MQETGYQISKRKYLSYDVFSLFGFIAARSARVRPNGRMILNINEMKRNVEEAINVADIERYFSVVSPDTSFDIILGTLMRGAAVPIANTIGACDTRVAYKALSHAGLCRGYNVEQFISHLRTGSYGLPKG